MEQSERPNKVLIGIIVAVVLVLVAGYFFYLTRKDNAVNQADEKSVSSEQSATANTDLAKDYKDGTYSATGTYQSPGGQEEIELTIAIKDGVVESTDAETNAASGTSRQYQREFVNNYQKLVVGKSVNEIELDRVAGSSLTSNGFNDALAEIKRQAAV